MWSHSNFTPIAIVRMLLNMNYAVQCYKKLDEGPGVARGKKIEDKKCWKKFWKKIKPITPPTNQECPQKIQPNRSSRFAGYPQRINIRMSSLFCYMDLKIENTKYIYSELKKIYFIINSQSVTVESLSTIVSYSFVDIDVWTINTIPN